jgi:hypothetical protein
MVGDGEGVGEGVGEAVGDGIGEAVGEAVAGAGVDAGDERASPGQTSSPVPAIATMHTAATTTAILRWPVTFRPTLAPVRPIPVLMRSITSPAPSRGFGPA